MTVALASNLIIINLLDRSGFFRMDVCLTLLVRDAERILEENLEFHLAQGVDYFIITDNLSVDGTAEIIQRYVNRGLAEAIFEPCDDYSQARWVTRMARRAAARGAQWIINSDDDEFWYAPSGTLRETLMALPESLQALSIERRNHPPIGGSTARRFVDAMYVRERSSYNAFGVPLLAKVCHRGSADIEVMQGNHAVARAGMLMEASPCASIEISHFPLRDYASFENKIIKGGAAYGRNTELPPYVGESWRYLHRIWQEGNLRSWFDQQVFSTEAVAAGLAEGSLQECRVVSDYLRAVVKA